MTDAFRALLTTKLDDPDPVVRAHAAARLAMHDGELPDPVARPHHAHVLRVMRCRARTRDPDCGCSGMDRCGKFGKDVSIQDCLACADAGTAELD